jgi:hypothetical protein
MPNSSLLMNVISNEIKTSANHGCDEVRQYGRAVRAAMDAAPSLTTNEAARLVNSVMEAQDR